MSPSEIVISGLHEGERNFSASSVDKNLSDYEKRYDKGTGKPIKDYIRQQSYAEDQDFGGSTINEKESDESMSKTETEKESVGTPTRLGHIFELKGVLNNLGVKEFRGSGILGKVRGKIKSKMKGKGAIMGAPESPKLLGGKFLDGGLKEALTELIMSRAHGVEKTQSLASKEAKEQRDKSRRQGSGAVTHHEEKFERKGLSVSW